MIHKLVQCFQGRLTPQIVKCLTPYSTFPGLLNIFLVCNRMCICMSMRDTCDNRLRAMDRLPWSVCFALIWACQHGTQETQDNVHVIWRYLLTTQYWLQMKERIQAVFSFCAAAGKIAWNAENMHVTCMHNYRYKISCLDMSKNVTHYIHHPQLYLNAYKGTHSPMKGTSCFHGRSVP